MNYKSLVVLPVHNQAVKINKALPLLEELCQGESDDSYDLLIVDDSSDDGLDDILDNNKWIKCLRHDERIGVGGAFISAYKYSLDFEYDIMIMLDPGNDEYPGNVAPMMENLKYGYDMVSCSRILENYDYANCPERHVDITAALSNALQEVTDETYSDPLSAIKAFHVKALENMDLTEFNHGLFIQLLVQSAYFGLNCIEIPAVSGGGFAKELDLDEDPLGLYLSVLETERHLYKKTHLN